MVIHLFSMGNILQQPIVYFTAGMLVPTIAYFFLGGRSGGSKNINTNTMIDVGDWDDESDSEDDGVTYPIQGGANPSKSWGMMDAPYKMVLCVNTSLGMGKGECESRRSSIHIKIVLLHTLAG